MFTANSFVILSSFSHARLTKFAALLQKSTEINVKEVTVKIIKLGQPEILEAIQGMDYYVIVCRESTDDLQRIKKDIEDQSKFRGNIFTFEEIDKAVAEPDTFGSALCRRIGTE